MLPSKQIYCTLFRNVGKTIPYLEFVIKNINKNLIRNFHLSFNYNVQVPFILSDIGEGIREVVVKEWFVKVGDKVSQFDNICEVQSDKASVTITSRYDGVISKLYYEIDETALVGKALVDIDVEDNKIQDEVVPKKTLEVPENKNQDLKPKLSSLNIEKSKEILSIPSVRRLAKENNVDLSSIQGSGKEGRILKEDVLKYLKIDDKQDQNYKKLETIGRIQPIKSFQKVMVKTMTESLKIPHLVYGEEISTTKLSYIKKIVKDHNGTKLSYLSFFIKAASNALQQYPIINCAIDEKCENIYYRDQHNIGIAMDTKLGLAVPIIKNVEKMDILAINNELNRLLLTGKEGNFKPDDLTGGTFTLSNIGSIGGTYMKPIIISSQMALVTLGKAQVLPRFDENKNVVAKEIINVSAAADHRIVDGATMARFITSLKKQIENPYLLFLNL